MTISRIPLAIAAAVTAAGLVLTGASSASAAPSTGAEQASSRVYLGTYFDNALHDYSVDVSAGSYVVEYDWSVGGGVNTWVDATHPQWVPLPSGTYLGQTYGGAGWVTDSKAFSLTAGKHLISSDSPELRGPVDVYLVRS
jgi:hypothetical protein